MQIFLVLFFALILRLVLVNQSLWLDEAIEILAVKNNSYLQLITSYSLGDFHPPLYHLVLKFWTQLFGISEIAARSLSVLTGVGTVFVAFLIGKEISNEKLGTIAAVFLATAPLHIYYSQEARMYSLVTFFASLAVYAFLRLKKDAKLFNWGLFSVASLGFFYTDYLPWLMVIPFNLWVFWQRKTLDQRWKRIWIVVQVLLLVFLLLWLPYFLKQLEIGKAASVAAPLWSQTVGGFTFKALPLTLAKFIFGRISFYDKILYGFIFSISGLFFGVLILRNLFQVSKERVFLIFWLFLPIISGWIISLFIPIYSYFRFLFVLPTMYLLLVVGILYFKNFRVQITLIILVLTINLVSQIFFWTNPRFWREDWRSAVSYIESQSQDENTAVIFVNLAQSAPYQYYARLIPFYGPDGWQDKNLVAIWLSRYVQPIFDPNDGLKKEVEAAGFVKIEEKDFNSVTFWKYQKLYANLY